MLKIQIDIPAEAPAQETSPARTQSVQSPCIQVCRLDASGMCEGCHRTREEITLWTRLTEAQQRAVLVRCRERAGERPGSCD
jgi:predicted Fe-S protein YdhL (DUF1289 family)